MTLLSIIHLALSQLDENPADMSEMQDLFRRYANEGYQIALRDYLRPREVLTIRTDKEGSAYIGGMDVLRVVALTKGDQAVYYRLSGDGLWLHTRMKSQTLDALCEVERPDLCEGSEEPQMPGHAHAALADYICYRHLAGGGAAKQSRALHYQQQFYQAMRRLVPEGYGSVCGQKHLYTVTDTRYRGDEPWR